MHAIDREKNNGGRSGCAASDESREVGGWDGEGACECYTRGRETSDVKTETEGNNEGGRNGGGWKGKQNSEEEVGERGVYNR